MDQVGTPFEEMYFFLYKIDGDFGYWLWDLENLKLIWSKNVVFNEDFIISDWTQP